MRARIRGWLTTIYAGLFMAIFYFGSVPVMVLTRSGALPMWFARKAWGPWGLWIAGVDLQVERKAPIPEGPAIFAANHSSTLDIWAAALESRRDEAIAIQSEEVYERYMKYLTGCAKMFRERQVDVDQFTLAK